MSNWSYVHGTIVVSPLGETQTAKDFVLKTVLEHLPKVTGSEKDMQVYTIQKNGINHWSYNTNIGDIETQTDYIIVVDGSLRDKKFNDALREFMKWIFRLSKKIMVNDVQVKITGDYDTKSTTLNYSDAYSQVWDIFGVNEAAELNEVF